MAVNNSLKERMAADMETLTERMTMVLIVVIDGRC